ncbi:MAG: hypothetical protein HY288_05600 [Planctomycetia bacterium]|nr:hypothetical protein [Planctomycetia bacterium]
MKRPWAVMLIAIALVGCRPAQPATNPFLRTTVPPPGTGQGALAVPGEPYYPPQAVPGTPPPAVAPAVPLAPPVAAPPPIVAPPSDNRYAPPGGSFQYNQSSLDRSKFPTNRGRDHPSTEASLAGVAGTNAPGLRGSAGGDAVQHAVLLSSEANPVNAASYHEPTAAHEREPTAGDTRYERPELAVDGENDASSPGNTVRILGSHSVDRGEAAAEPEIEAAPAIRITVDDSPRRDTRTQPPLQEAYRTAPNASASQIAIVTSDTVSDITQNLGDGSSPGVSPPSAGGRPQAAGAEGADYAFAPDYAWLRGRLEYSQSLRQWKLRYIPIDGQTDQFGGSVVLPNSPALEAFKPGDKVAVRGSLAERSATSGSFSPLYKFDHVEPLSR